MKTWMMVLGMSICLAGCDKKVEKQEEVTPSEFKNLLMMDEVHREAYESDVTYQVGDPVIFLDDSGVLWQVTLTSYE